MLDKKWEIHKISSFLIQNVTWIIWIYDLILITFSIARLSSCRITFSAIYSDLWELFIKLDLYFEKCVSESVFAICCTVIGGITVSYMRSNSLKRVAYDVVENIIIPEDEIKAERRIREGIFVSKARCSIVVSRLVSRTQLWPYFSPLPLRSHLSRETACARLSGESYAIDPD